MSDMCGAGASPAPRPFFSIIVPVYNRALLVGRALRSCLAQSFASFEVVVVDDGSSDASANVVRTFDDARIRLLIHEQNRGRCPARNTAMAAAKGEWFVFLDSDDELLPDALQTIHGDAVSAPEDVLALRYACIDDAGIVSPDPHYPSETWSYERYLLSIEESLDRVSEALPCSRTSTFPEIRYPDDHAEEGVYHLDLAKKGRVLVSPSVVRLYHHDAPNQITRPDFRRAMRFAADNARNVDVVLERHGEALRKHAPGAHALRLREGALYHFMAGDRRAGFRYARQSRFSLKLAAIVSLGMMGGSPLAFVQALQGAMRRPR